MKKVRSALIAAFFLCMTLALAGGCMGSGSSSSSQESSVQSSESSSVSSSEAPIQSSEEASSEAPVQSSEEASSEAPVQSSEEVSSEEESSEAPVQSSEEVSSEEESSEAPVQSSEEVSSEEESSEAPVQSSEEVSSEEESSEAPVQSSEEASSEEESSEAPVESSEEESSEAPVESSEEESSEAPVESSEEESSEAPVESSEESSSEEDSSDVVVDIPPVSQGDDRHEMPTYAGDATELGFPAGTETVYTVVGAPWAEDDNTAWDNRIVIATEAGNDYLKFDVVFSADNAVLSIWPGPNGYYTLSPSGLEPKTETADPTRKAVIVDANGFAVTSLKANTVYTVYFYLNADDPNVSFSTFMDMTTYVANIEFGNGDVNVIVPSIYSQGKAAPLSVYKDDVTELGFVAGTTVVQLQTTGSTWNDAAYFDTDDTTNCLTVNFAFATAPTAGSQLRIYAWYGAENGWIKSIVDCQASDVMTSLPKDVEVLNADGTPVTAWEANTVYTLKIYHEGATALAICFDETTVDAGSIIYFDNAIVENNDEYVAPVLPEPEPDPERPTIYSCKDTSSALSVYDGDVTSLGFAAGTNVYKLTSASDWDDRVGIQADNNYKYLDVQFMVEEGAWYFLVWLCDANSMLDGYYLVAENSANPAGVGYAIYNGTKNGNTKIQVLDANGNVVTGVRPNGTVYTLRVWLEDESITEVQIGQANVTMYFGNVECTNEEPQPTPGPSTPAGPSVSQGDDRHEMPTYEGDATDLGFPAGTETVYTVVGKPWAADDNTTWDNRIIIATEEGKDYLKFDVVFSIDDASLTIWPGPNGSHGFSSSGVTSSDTADSTRRILLLDADGCQPTSWKANTLYTVYFYLNDNDPSVQINSFKDMTTYIANIEFGNGDVVAKYAIVQGDKRVAMPKYDGDVTSLGFAAGATVYALENTLDGGWGDTWTTRAIIGAPTTQDYVTIEFVSTVDMDSTPFHLWGVAAVPSIGSVGFATRDIGLITDMNGYAVKNVKAGQHYLLHMACKGLSEIQLGLINGVNTVYFANVSYNNGTFTALQAPADLISSGASNDDAVKAYTGDVTELGFKAGSQVFEFVCESTGTDKLAIAVDCTYDYVEFDFVVGKGDGYFFAWGLKNGSWHNGGTSYVIDPSWIRLGDGNNTASDRTIQIFDAEGNEVNTALEVGTLYTLRVYVKVGSLDQVMIGKNGSTIYVANVRYGNDA